MNFYFDWSDATITRLRDLWAEGHSTAEIGRRLGCGKNAAVGKAHRLDLPARPSPVALRGAAHPNWKPRGTDIAPRSRRERGALAAIRELRTLEPTGGFVLPSKPGAFMESTFRPMDYREPIDASLARQLNEAKRLAPRPTLTPGAHVGAAKSCQFPIGDPREPGFMFCGEPVERDESGAPTGSYCWRCRQRCYTRTRRQEWAA